MRKSVSVHWSSESAAAVGRSAAGLQSVASHVSSRQELQLWSGTSGIAKPMVLVSGIYGGTRFSVTRLCPLSRRSARSCASVASPSSEAVRGHGTPQLCGQVVAFLHNMPLVPTAHPLARVGTRAIGAAPAQRRH